MRRARDRGGRRAAPGGARELEWILARRSRTWTATRGRARVTVRLRRLGGRAVLTVADDGGGFDVPDELDELAGRLTSGWPACASARSWRAGPQRRVGAGRRLRAVGVVLRPAGTGWPAPPRACGRAEIRGAGAEPPPAAELPRPRVRRARSVPGYTWQ